MVVLNAVDAQARGATILTRTKVVSVKRQQNFWDITTEDQITGATSTYRARTVVNAAGPWVAEVLGQTLNVESSESVRLVRGSHIVVPKLYDHDQPYILQGTDGRIVFAIPYEDDFTLIGTTDVDHGADPQSPVCTDDETEYLCEFVSNYFKTPVTSSDVVWSYSGVRPLYDDGASSASAATRDYVLSLNTDGATLLNVFGGKITTYRVLAEDVLAKLGNSRTWTEGVALPGGDFPWDTVEDKIAELQSSYSFLDRTWAHRLIRTYGTQAAELLGNAQSVDDLGRDFGATLTETELNWLYEHEFARTGEDVLWRRTKLGLRLSQAERQAVTDWMTAQKERAA